MPFMHKSFRREPPSNFEEADIVLNKWQTKELGKRSFLGHRLSSSFGSGALSSFSSLVYKLEVHTERPSDHHTLYDLHVNPRVGTLSCFLWQRSFFYTKALTNVNGWYLSWFTFTRDSVYSVPDRTEGDKHKMTYPLFMGIEADLDRLILKIPNPNEGKRDRTYSFGSVIFLARTHSRMTTFFLILDYWMATSKDLFVAVVKKCEAIMEIREAEDTKVLPIDARPDDEGFMDADPQESLIEFPWAGSLTEIVFHVLLFPIKALMYYTIPDVRHLDSEGNPKSGLGTAFLAILMCLVWLIVGSYAMVASLEALAELMDISEAVIGVTVSAAGTSLPNYVASKVAAEKGFGVCLLALVLAPRSWLFHSRNHIVINSQNMAVSNAFGSNTFNIMVGLGWPWLFYIMFANNFQPYDGLRNDGILESVIILATVLMVFIVLMLISDFALYRWHGNLFLVLYVAYLVFAIGPVYL
jgi:Ca2+/Na+ antiporter